MKTKREQKNKKAGENLKEKGNALIYVLIAVVLFAALSFTLMNQARNEGTDEIDDAKTGLYATQIIAYAAQAKSALDNMSFSGSKITDFDFVLPGETGFNTAPHTHKLFHPASGGLLKGTLPAAAVTETGSNPAPGWYTGRFNNVEWTDTSGTDIILTAYQISKAVCENINEKATGSTTIPALPGDPKLYLIDDSAYSGGSNTDLDIAACASCEGYMSLCVSDNTASTFAFYTVLADR